jgi:hypothetical protein
MRERRKLRRLTRHLSVALFVALRFDDVYLRGAAADVVGWAWVVFAWTDARAGCGIICDLVICLSLWVGWGDSRETLA